MTENTMRDKEYRCFHCEEVFTSVETASEHFGTQLHHEPACQIDIAKFRDMEARFYRSVEEDTDTDRAMYAMQGKHRQELIQAEELGYSRGVRDMQKEAAIAHQNQEAVPIYQIEGVNWADVSKEQYEVWKKQYPHRIVFLAPPQPQTVKDALEAAARICDQWGEADKKGLAVHHNEIVILLKLVAVKLALN